MQVETFPRGWRPRSDPALKDELPDNVGLVRMSRLLPADCTSAQGFSSLAGASPTAPYMTRSTAKLALLFRESEHAAKLGAGVVLNSSMMTVDEVYFSYTYMLFASLMQM